MIHPNLIEYATRELFKRERSLKTICKRMHAKFNGQNNVFLGGDVVFTADELYAAVLLDKAVVTIKGFERLRAGRERIGVEGSAATFNLNFKELLVEVRRVLNWRGEEIPESIRTDWEFGR